MISKTISLVALSLFAAVAMAGTTFAAPHKTPIAPAEYLEKKSPVDPTNAAALASGKKLYELKCKRCHGINGDGKGSSAKGCKTPVTAFNGTGYLASRKDGQLFWIISKGSPNTDMDAFGAGSPSDFSDEDVWNVIAFMRSKYTK